MADRSDGDRQAFEAKPSSDIEADRNATDGYQDVITGDEIGVRTGSWSWPSIAALSFALFGALAFLGVELTRVAENVAVFWPANAAIIALGLAVGRQYMFPILAGSFTANALIQYLLGDHWVTCFGMPLANSIEIFLILFVLERLDIGFRSITSLRPALYLISVLACSTVPAAVIGSGALMLVHDTPFSAVAVTWWLGDLSSSMIVLLPLLSPWPPARKIREWLDPSPKRLLEIGAGFVLMVSGYFLFDFLGLAPISAIIPLFLWVAMRGGVFPTALFCTLVFLFEVVSIVFTSSPILSSGTDTRDAVFQLQILSIVTALPVYLVAVSIHAQQVTNTKLSVKVDKAKLESSLLAGTLAGLNFGISCFDNKQRLTVWNKRYAEMFGMENLDLVAGTNFIDLLQHQKDEGNFEGDPQDLVVSITQRLAEGIEFRTETELSDDRIIYTIHSPAPAGGWIATHEDVTERHKEVDIIRNQALHDPLTDLPNRRYFDEYLAKLKKDISRTENEGIAILQVDLDHFKQVNDTLGHDAGDMILKHAANILKSVLRETDFVARVGGDEFVVICPVTESTDFLPKLAQRLINQIKKPIDYKGHSCQIGVSVGIACGTGQKIDFLGVMRTADEALYEAKNQGRNCFVASGIPDLRLAS